jgi:hypothetical protein
MKTRLITVLGLLSMVLMAGCAAVNPAAIPTRPAVITAPASQTDNSWLDTAQPLTTTAILTGTISENSPSPTEPNPIIDPPVNTPSQTSAAPASVRVDLPVPKISVAEVYSKLNDAEDFILVDVRSKADYAKGHLAGALSISIDVLTERYTEISLQAEVIVYSACT